MAEYVHQTGVGCSDDLALIRTEEIPYLDIGTKTASVIMLVLP